MAPKPVAVVCVGMAGSGKTTFMQRINSHLHAKGDPPYIMNLDPAVRSIPFNSNIDIRDSIDYKEVMSQYNLGPNGGILTSLNLFATKVDQIMGILESRCGMMPEPITPGASMTAPEKATASLENHINHILVDTPGQIEVFVWSASGQILLSSLASAFPTVLAYVIDTPRTASTSTFMSNMLYACSILYKTKLPMILVFNKTDVQSADFAKDWMTDFETFQAALQKEEETGQFGGLEGESTGSGPGPGGNGYMGSLLNSMSMVLDEFYKHLQVVGVSSMTGEGVDEFFAAVGEKAAEFERDYRPELERRRHEREKDRSARREQELGKLMKDLEVDTEGYRGHSKPKDMPETISDLDDTDEEESEGDDVRVKPEESLTERYEQALTKNSGENPTVDDESFLRYVKQANINR
ncbi:hypothetical protein FH972_021909 [Carpinus fangiana]|uniref:GPN-loop GTPase n=1 Tax=Carpinus fangiana TaxID=176857 RepID=A0A5N6KR95_9ROSI|nr:hypothetical protein FH972_021909 [Carpinus fangiana]